MITIKKINNSDFSVDVTITSNKYLDINKSDSGFLIEWKDSKKEIIKTMKNISLSKDIENAVAYGAFDNNQLVGFIEGYLEEWNNRFRITNMFIFKEEYQNKGIGTRLINKVFKEAKNSNARMVVLETQSYNSKAISFYERNGFEIIGFDRYAYRNNDPSRHEMRIELGKKVLI